MPDRATKISQPHEGMLGSLPPNLLTLGAEHAFYRGLQKIVRPADLKQPARPPLGMRAMHRQATPDPLEDQKFTGSPSPAMPQGTGPLFGDPDPDVARAFFMEKSRAEADKRMGAKEVVERFITDGCYLAIGGFGSNRIPTTVIH